MLIFIVARERLYTQTTTAGVIYSLNYSLPVHNYTQQVAELFVVGA